MVNKLSNTLILALALSCVHSWKLHTNFSGILTECPNVHCWASEYDDPKTVCLNEHSGIHYIRGCANGQTCPYDDLTSTPINCVDGPSSQKSRLPGEYCDKDTDCVDISSQVPGDCKRKVCQGLPIGTASPVQAYCQPGAYYDKSAEKCVALLALGEKCTGSEQCPANSLCHFTSADQGECILFHSLDAGEPVIGCKSLENNYAGCISGVCFTESGNEDGICTSRLNVRYTGPCESDLECGTSRDPVSYKVMYSECSCALETTGQAYCHKGPGNPEANDYWVFMEEWLMSKEIHQCSNLGKLSPYCVKATLGQDAFEEYMIATAKIQEWPIYGNSQACTYEAIWTEFQMQNSANIVGLGLFALVALL